MEKNKVKSKQLPKKEVEESNLTAKADYRSDSWFAIVGYDGSDVEVYAKLAATEEAAYEDAIAEIQRLNLITKAT